MLDALFDGKLDVTPFAAGPDSGMTLLSNIFDQIQTAEPKYARKLRSQLDRMDDRFYHRAEEFFARYQNLMVAQGKGLDFGVDCYLKLRTSMLKERIRFLRTGRYANSSFAEVNQHVYSDPETMPTHMHGLAFAQFLWPEQYCRFAFFCENLPGYLGPIRRYLEVGGGHALYIAEAYRLLGGRAEFDLVDISPHSMELARGMTPGLRIDYHLMNIFDFPSGTEYDFITMGEVLEHVERPLELLGKVRSLLAPAGRLYITTPANAPTLDHIYLFHDEEEIRRMLRAGGFEIEREVLRYSEDTPVEQAKADKIALMYGAFVRKT
jgi:SAM-dependent methyltransferase